jgi:hypothetical protein
VPRLPCQAPAPRAPCGALVSAPVSAPWQEPGDDVDADDIAAAADDLATAGAGAPELVARLYHWLGAWQAWARTLVTPPDPTLSYGDAGNREAIQSELLARRRDVENHRAYVCRECRAEIGEMHKMSCHAESRARVRREEHETHEVRLAEGLWRCECGAAFAPAGEPMEPACAACAVMQLAPPLGPGREREGFHVKLCDAHDEDRLAHRMPRGRQP